MMKQETPFYSMKNSRLVYSTESGRNCPACNKPFAKCRCKQKNIKSSLPSDDGIVKIRREVKGRGGKTVTAVSGIQLEEKELKTLAKTLKKRCGTGGSVKEGVIIIQGDHRKTLLHEIQKWGYTVKLAGG